MSAVTIKPIKSEKDYQAALQKAEKLFHAKPNTKQGDQLEILSTLIEAYEEQHHKIDFPDPIDAILYWMESRGLERKDLAPYIGSRARISEVLSRKRDLTLAMIRRLNTGLEIPAEILIKLPKHPKHHHVHHR